MSHRKVYSQGSIPFSWEDKPGISKVTNKDCFIDGTNLQVLDLEPSLLRPPPSLLSNSSPKVEDNYGKKIIPLPPCPLSTQPPRRSTSLKDYSWQDDPFLLAYKVCTKTGHEDDGGKKGFVIGSKALRKKSKSVFSCKNSCDTRDDNFVKLSNLPPLPRHKIHSLW